MVGTSAGPSRCPGAGKGKRRLADKDKTRVPKAMGGFGPGAETHSYTLSKYKRVRCSIVAVQSKGRRSLIVSTGGAGEERTCTHRTVLCALGVTVCMVFISVEAHIIMPVFTTLEHKRAERAGGTNVCHIQYPLFTLMVVLYRQCGHRKKRSSRVFPSATMHLAHHSKHRHQCRKAAVASANS